MEKNYWGADGNFSTIKKEGFFFETQIYRLKDIDFLIFTDAICENFGAKRFNYFFKSVNMCLNYLSLYIFLILAA